MEHAYAITIAFVPLQVCGPSSSSRAFVGPASDDVIMWCPRSLFYLQESSLQPQFCPRPQWLSLSRPTQSAAGARLAWLLALCAKSTGWRGAPATAPCLQRAPMAIHAAALTSRCLGLQLQGRRWACCDIFERSPASAMLVPSRLAQSFMGGRYD